MNRAPQLGALLFAVAASLCAAVQLHDLPAGASTAQAVAMGAAIVMIVLGGVAGWVLGSTARIVYAAGRPRVAAGVAAGGALMLALLCGAFWSGHKHESRLARIRTETLTPERARELAKGPAEDVRALVYNRTCPPEMLVQFRHSPDETVRAGVGGNPNTPLEVLDELAKDPSESVRLYVSLNPSRRKP